MTAATLCIVSPDLPPRRGGVADHTYWLARHLASEFDLRIVASEGLPDLGFAKIRAEIGDWADAARLEETVLDASAGGAVIWQYVPHMYGRGGVNLGLPKVMRRLRARKLRQIVMVHEIAAPLSLWPHRLLYAIAHRWQWAQLLRCADGLGISTEAWLLQCQTLLPRYAEKLFLSPSPSNIPGTPITADHRNRWRQSHHLPSDSLVIGFLGTLSTAKRFEWLPALCRTCKAEGLAVGLAISGDTPTSVADLPESVRLIPLGYQEPLEVSGFLQAIDLLALPFIDGASERRTSLMAGLSHRCAVLTTLGPNSGPHFRQGGFVAAVDSRDLGGFCREGRELLKDPARRQALGATGQRVYADQFDWPVVGRRIREALKQ